MSCNMTYAEMRSAYENSLYLSWEKRVSVVKYKYTTSFEVKLFYVVFVLTWQVRDFSNYLAVSLARSMELVKISSPE